MIGLEERLKDLKLDDFTAEKVKEVVTSYEIKESFNDSHDKSFIFSFAFNGGNSILTTVIYILFAIGAYKMLVSENVIGGIINFLTYLK